MTKGKQRRLTDHLTESRILVQQYRPPLVRILLSLAETIVEDGAIRNPLEYYKELANESSPWIALPKSEVVPAAKIYQVCSREVKKLTAALALCPEGVQSEGGQTIHLVLLISAPDTSVPSYLALLAHVVRLLESKSHRDSLLGSKSPVEALALLSRLESADASSPQS